MVVVSRNKFGTRVAGNKEVQVIQEGMRMIKKDGEMLR